MGGALARREEKRNACRVLVLYGKKHLENTGLNERDILKLILTL
jgi:hypothetical protein